MDNFKCIQMNLSKQEPRCSYSRLRAIHMPLMKMALNLVEQRYREFDSHDVNQNVTL